jgi:hypothetical protein
MTKGVAETLLDFGQHNDEACLPIPISMSAAHEEAP